VRSDNASLELDNNSAERAMKPVLWTEKTGCLSVLSVAAEPWLSFSS